jgi:hypothetical protein
MVVLGTLASKVSPAAPLPFRHRIVYSTADRNPWHPETPIEALIPTVFKCVDPYMGRFRPHL